MSPLFTHLVPLMVMVMLLPTEAVTLDIVTLHGKDGMCLPQEVRESAILNVTASIEAILQGKIYSVDLQSSCGEGLWDQVAYLNMNDPSQQCPPAWREYSVRDLGIRTCRRPQSSSGSCHGTFYSTGRQYSKVCGRAIGYQIGGTDAFSSGAAGQTIDSYYVYGISVTHGQPRNHIWTLASGISEGGHVHQRLNCPCSNPSSSANVYPPSFVGDNYYCESGNPTSTFSYNQLFSGDPLWDGQQCEGECCSNGKSPPWFSVELPNSTANAIEVRICIGEASHRDDVALEILEIYVQ